MLKKIFYGLNGKVFPEGQSHLDIKTGAPVVAIDNGYAVEREGSDSALDFHAGHHQKLLRYLEEEYRKWGQFGPYGDVISVTCYSDQFSAYYSINYFGRFEYYKPSLAADLLPFIFDRDGRAFFVGIVRGKEPGKGKPAFIGGHQDIKGFDFETAAGALLHESKDEAAFSIAPIDGWLKDMKKPLADSVYVRVNLAGRSVEANLELLGTYRTGWEEKVESIGRKRVDQTTAYLLPLVIDESLDCATVSSWFKAGDDAREIAVIQADKDIPDFGLSHHMLIYLEAVEKLWVRRALSLPAVKWADFVSRVTSMQEAAEED